MNYPTVADAHIQNLTVQKALEIVGQGAVPVTGTLSADAHVAGTMQAPDANLQFQFARANVYGEPIDRLGGSVHYANTAIQIPSIQLEMPAGRVTLNGSYSHPAGSLDSGALTLKVDSSELQLARSITLCKRNPGLQEPCNSRRTCLADVRERNGRRELLFSRLNADMSANRLRVGRSKPGPSTIHREEHRSEPEVSIQLRPCQEPSAPGWYLSADGRLSKHKQASRSAIFITPTWRRSLKPTRRSAPRLTLSLKGKPL